MSEQVNDGKRGFLKTAMLGAGASAVGAAAPGVALAQMLETNIREDSVLAKIRKEGGINVGYAQTGHNGGMVIAMADASARTVA